LFICAAELNPVVMTRKPSVLFSLITGVALFCVASIVVPAQRRVRSTRLPDPQANTTIRARSGESLKAIANRSGHPVAELARLNNLKVQSRLKAGQLILLPAEDDQGDAVLESSDRQIVGNRIRFVDGGTLDVEEAWKRGDLTWYKRGGVMQSLERPVRTIEPIYGSKPKPAPKSQLEVAAAPAREAPRQQVWIFLVGGARLKVDEVNETSAGAWYSRGNMSFFLESERIARISREDPFSTGRGWKNSDWSSGNSRIDELIRVNGHRYGVDPYLVFCVIEQESHFHPRALSPKGARGLMQLMPGTARRFGVRNSYDVAENIKGGTQYLRELMDMFGGKVNLVLASYNAGEGAVMKYGRNVPPYRETREYVKKIGKRYGLGAREPGSEIEAAAPRR
jgi:soluble lytic murein transglycosylase-like protein